MLHGLSPLKGVAALASVCAVTLLPTEAKSDATTAMAARLMLGSPEAPAKNCPSPQAAMPNAKARDMLSTVGAAATAALVATAVVTAVTVAVLGFVVSTNVCPVIQTVEPN